MAGVKSSLPSHLKPGPGADQEAVFERRHGKTRSHMVSEFFPFINDSESRCKETAFPLCLATANSSIPSPIGGLAVNALAESLTA